MSKRRIMKPRNAARQARRRTVHAGFVLLEHRGNRAQRRKAAALQRKEKANA